jgi:hypothetical protein
MDLKEMQDKLLKIMRQGTSHLQAEDDSVLISKSKQELELVVQDNEMHALSQYVANEQSNLCASYDDIS